MILRFIAKVSWKNFFHEASHMTSLLEVKVIFEQGRRNIGKKS